MVPGADWCRELSKLLGWSHIGWVAGSRRARAAGSGEERGSGGDKGKFHEVYEFVLIGGRHETHARLQAD
jgi:hypothetical protein